MSAKRYSGSIRLLLLFCLAGFCLPAFGQGNPVDPMGVDVTKRKGIPLEWSLHRKTIRLNIDPDTRGMGAPPPPVVEKPKEEPKETGGSAVLEREKHEVDVRQVQEALDYNTPRDPWKAAGVSVPMGDVMKLPKWVLEEPKYEPKPDMGMRLTVAAEYLRVMLYEKDYHIPYMTCYIIEMGQMGLFAAQELEKEGPELGRVAKSVLACIGEAAPPLPAPKTGATPEETFMLRLIQEELGRGYLHQPQPGFARHIADMGETVVPYVLDAALRHEHKLVRQNATGLLGDMGDTPAIRAGLRKIAASDEPVAAIRALMILTRLKDPDIVPYLLGQLREPASKNPEMRHLAAFCLSSIGVADIVPALLTWAEEAKALPKKDVKKQREILWTCIDCLVRLGETGKEAMDLYSHAYREYPASDSLYQLAILGALRVDDPKAIDEFARLTEYDKQPLLRLAPGSCTAALEVFRRVQGRSERDYLMEIIRQPKEDLFIQMQAMACRHFAPEDAPAMENLLADETIQSAVKTVLFFHFWEIDRDKCRELARQVILRYMGAANRDTSQKLGADFDTLTALRMLSHRKSLTTAELIAIVERSWQDQRDAKEYNDKAVKNAHVSLTYPPPIFEQALLDLGKLRAAEAEGYLAKTVNDTRNMGREAAVKGLYFLATPTALETLVHALEDPADGWVRHYAAYGLKQLSKTDFPCDWVWGDEKQLAAGREFWRNWLRDEKKKKK